MHQPRECTKYCLNNIAWNSSAKAHPDLFINSTQQYCYPRALFTLKLKLKLKHDMAFNTIY